MDYSELFSQVKNTAVYDHAVAHITSVLSDEKTTSKAKFERVEDIVLAAMESLDNLSSKSKPKFL